MALARKCAHDSANLQPVDLENAARFYLGITGEEFIERWDSGYYDEEPDHPDVVDVAMLLPFAR